MSKSLSNDEKDGELVTMSLGTNTGVISHVFPPEFHHGEKYGQPIFLWGDNVGSAG
jgi:hypothetical protein